jgi:hypothetical protein
VEEGLTAAVHGGGTRRSEGMGCGGVLPAWKPGQGFI